MTPAEHTQHIRPFSYAFDADQPDGEQWVVTKKYRSGWSVVTKFATKAKAEKYIWNSTGAKS